MTFVSRISSAALMAAALSMVNTPAFATDFKESSPSVRAASFPAVQQWDADSQNVENYRWGRYGGYGGRYHRRNRVDAGDVIAGVLILGSIAAVASAASKANRQTRESYPYPRRRGSSGYTGDQNINSAVNNCMREIERDVRVDNVDSVYRSGNGWAVTGTIYNGDSFTCNVGSNGSIDSINYGQRSFSSQDNQSPVYQSQDNQWSDDRYAQAWNDQIEQNQLGQGQAAPQPQQAYANMPAYPGGPLPGDIPSE